MMTQEKIKMDKGWQWLLYLDIILPLILFLIALLIPSGNVKQEFSTFFHTYNMYVINVIPNFINFTGILGIIIHLGAIIYGIVKKNKVDIIICCCFLDVIFLYFVFKINYMLIPFLEFV